MCPPHAPAVCVPSPPSLRGAAAPLVALSACVSLPHRRFEVLQRPFSRSLRGRLVTPVLRRRESSAHCVYGLGLPARAANPHREHRLLSSIFDGDLSGVHGSVPTAILAAFSHTPSFSVHGVVLATRLSLGTRSHNRRCQTVLQSQFEEHPARAHHVRISSSEALKNQEDASSPSRPSLATPPSIQQSRASSDAPDAFSAQSTPASLERSIRRAPQPARPGLAKAPRQHARSVTGVLYRPCHAQGLDTTPHHPHHLLRARWSFPMAGAAFIAPPAPSASPQVPLSPIHTHAGRILNTARTTPRARSSENRSPSPGPRLSLPHPSPPCPAPTILRSKPAPVRHREYDAQHRRSAQQVQRAFPVARAAFIASPCAATILCAHAALSSTPRPAAHRERDVHHPRRVALRPSPSPRNLPAFHVRPQRHSAPLVDDSATPRPMRSTPRGGFPSLAPAAEAIHTPRFTVPAFGAKDGWGTPTSLGATNPSGDSRTYAPPIFQIAPPPVQFGSPASAASSGKGAAGMYIGEFDIWACIDTLKIIVSGVLSPTETRRIEYAELEQASDYRSRYVVQDGARLSSKAPPREAGFLGYSEVAAYRATVWICTPVPTFLWCLQI
ncbi:hypothetical protein B0H14DRAFT_3511290 [Mycena olivaceomarginata]|nr:hypothetical protein B0H14DRAFT_3511290 [Mycena olivaceomarginata]